MVYQEVVSASEAGLHDSYLNLLNVFERRWGDETIGVQKYLQLDVCPSSGLIRLQVECLCLLQLFRNDNSAVFRERSGGCL